MRKFSIPHLPKPSLTVTKNVSGNSTDHKITANVGGIRKSITIPEKRDK